jgi:hypothetical protein
VVRWTATSPGPVSHLAGAIGGVNFWAWLGSFIALVWGTMGLVQRGHTKTLAAWGVGLNGLFCFGLLATLLVLGR